MMATLYDVTVSAINQYLKRIYDDSELERGVTIKKYLIVQYWKEAKTLFLKGRNVIFKDGQYPRAVKPMPEKPAKAISPIIASIIETSRRTAYTAINIEMVLM
jgi:hypothetical protein